MNEGDAEPSNGEAPAFGRTGQNGKKMSVILPLQCLQNSDLVSGGERQAGAKIAACTHAQLLVEQDEMKDFLERTIVIGDEQIAGEGFELFEDFDPWYTY